MNITDNKINVVSLFDGMSCGMIALTESDFEVENYVAYEVDKYAIQTSEYNFPKIEQRGNVFEADFSEFEGYDLVIGGSPCTYWSVAQKFGRETEASGVGWDLFCQFKRAIEEVKPKYFLYENNKSMSNAIKQSITNTFGFDPVNINSSLLSAQTRNRLYWVGKRENDGTYSRINVPIPVDRGYLMRDILDDVIPINITSDGKCRPIKAQYQRTNEDNILCNAKGSTFGATGVAEPVNPISSQKSRCLTASYANKGAKHILDSFYSDVSYKQKWDAVAVTIEFLDGEPIKAISYIDGREYRVHKVTNGKIEYKSTLRDISLKDGYYIIRKMTVDECRKLQTIPDWYKFPVSNYRAYTLIGNGWTIEVIKWILKYIKEDMNVY